MTPRSRRRGGALLAITVPAAVALAACGGHKTTYPAASPPPVPLSVASSIAKPIKVGVVVSKTSPVGQGQDDLELAAGARVAEYRLGLANRGAVTLDVVDDGGTAAGSKAAVQQLLDHGDVGIVYASEGDHMNTGIALAQAAHTAVLLPYATTGPTGEGVWYTGPTTSQVVDAIGKAMTAKSLSAPVVLTTSTVTGLSAVQPHATDASLGTGTAVTGQVAAAVAKVGAAGQPDTAVVWGGAADEAQAVGTVQQGAAALGNTIPLYLGPSALSSTFATSLAALSAKAQANASGQLVTAGLDATDATGTPTMLAFLQAVRLAAADSTVPGLVTNGSFSKVGAAYADARSHDAVLAIVDATATARSAEPAKVLAALKTLQTPATLGLAGPALDFRQPAAVADADVVVLQSTSQSSGQRAGVGEDLPVVGWFAATAKS